MLLTRLLRFLLRPLFPLLSDQVRYGGPNAFYDVHVCTCNMYVHVILFCMFIIIFVFSADIGPVIRCAMIIFNLLVAFPTLSRLFTLICSDFLRHTSLGICICYSIYVVYIHLDVVKRLGAFCLNGFGAI